MVYFVYIGSCVKMGSSYGPSIGMGRTGNRENGSTRLEYWDRTGHRTGLGMVDWDY